MFKWDNKFTALAMYNAEISRGIVHTEEYCKKMAILQDEYDARIQEAARKLIKPDCPECGGR